MARFRMHVILTLVTVGCSMLAWHVWPRQTTAAAASSPLPIDTSRSSLDRAADLARARLGANRGDAEAGIALADVLLRKARVEGRAAHAMEAERVLDRVLRDDPRNYPALKTIGAVYLSQHRFRDAIAAAERAMRVQARDAWNYGVLGDAYLELGDYDRAFAAFDTMARLRPDAASYARVAYAHELQGRLPEALRYMQMAAEATSAHDPESLAWHYAQLGNLNFQSGNLDAAAREYARADYAFPRHPYARAGAARVAAARGETPRALELYRALMRDMPSPEVAATIGDLLTISRDVDGGTAMYREAEKLEREGWKEEEPQPAALARMLAERGLKVKDAVVLAEQAAARRSDIFTMDALALAYFKAGQLSEAAEASLQARRTGTADRRILYHAAVIERARGNADEARRLVARATEGLATFDPLVGPAALSLARDLEAR